MSSGPGLKGPPDPYDLDFTSLVEGPAAPPPPPATAENEEYALIGANALGQEGFHVVLARPRPGHPAHHVVLVVDDDAPTAEHAAHALRKAGYQAAVALTPRDAARHMSHLGPPALILLDVEMPEMNGLEFLRRLRRNKHLFDTPVILFTAHSDRQDIVRGLQSGADGYIAKPITAAALVSAVRTVLGH
jgi:CheY-like chemotaxis protein